MVIRRKDNGKLACIGGFVEVGETLEAAVRREVLEETGLEVTSSRMIPAVRESVSRGHCVRHAHPCACFAHKASSSSLSSQPTLAVRYLWGSTSCVHAQHTACERCKLSVDFQPLTENSAMSHAAMSVVCSPLNRSFVVPVGQHPLLSFSSLNATQICQVYDEPTRDSRRHTVSKHLVDAGVYAMPTSVVSVHAST